MRVFVRFGNATSTSPTLLLLKLLNGLSQRVTLLSCAGCWVKVLRKKGSKAAD